MARSCGDRRGTVQRGVTLIFACFVAGLLCSSANADGCTSVGGVDPTSSTSVPTASAAGTKKWEFETGNYVYSSPALSSDGATVFVGSDDRKLYAINTADGTKKWEFVTRDKVLSSPALSSDGATVFVGSRDNRLYAINTADGTKKWEFATGGDVYSSPALSSDGATVFVASDANKLYAFNTADGTKKWEFLTGGDVPALSSDGATVFVGSRDNKLYAINTADGTKKWEFVTGGDVDSSPALSSDGATVFVGSDDNKLYAINTADGTKKWEFETGSEVRSSPALSSDGATVFVGSFDHKLYAVNTADGTKKWEFETGYWVRSSPALSSDGATVFVGSFDNKLYAINTADGTKKWEFETGDIVSSSPALSSDGATVFVGSDDYKLYAINTGRSCTVDPTTGGAGTTTTTPIGSKTHASIAHKDGNTAMIWRSDGTRHGGPRKDYTTWTTSTGGEIQFGDRFIQFGTSSAWRFADINTTHSSIAYGGKTAVIYRSDGTIHPGPRTDYQASGRAVTGSLASLGSSSSSSGDGGISGGDGWIQVGRWRVGTYGFEGSKRGDTNHFVWSQCDTRKTAQIFRNDGTIHPGPHSDWHLCDAALNTDGKPSNVVYGNGYIEFRGVWRLGNALYRNDCEDALPGLNLAQQVTIRADFFMCSCWEAR
eukprot:g2208.t1